jgi:hypothetical protein
MTAPLLDSIDPLFDPLDVPLFAEHAFIELQGGNHPQLSLCLVGFAESMRCLPLPCQREVVIYLKQAMMHEPQMSARFLRRLLLDTAESVLAQRTMPSYL